MWLHTACTISRPTQVCGITGACELQMCLHNKLRHAIGQTLRNEATSQFNHKKSDSVKSHIDEGGAEFSPFLTQEVNL